MYAQTKATHKLLSTSNKAVPWNVEQQKRTNYDYISAQAQNKAILKSTQIECISTRVFLKKLIRTQPDPADHKSTENKDGWLRSAFARLQKCSPHRAARIE